MGTAYAASLWIWADTSMPSMPSRCGTALQQSGAALKRSAAQRSAAQFVAPWKKFTAVSKVRFVGSLLV
jgi:hypothetical protein